MNARRVPGYRILETLQDHGPLAIHLAREEASGQVVILETLLPDLFPSRGKADRWLDEARSLRKLKHPHLERVLDADRAAGIFYVVRGWIPGQTLGALFDTGWRFETLPALRIGAALASSVAYLHRRGRVHGMVCPRNVLIGTEEQVRLQGLGGLVTVDVTADVTLAPEVRAGERPLPSADIYGLGYILRRILGDTPEIMEDGRPGSVAALIHTLTAADPKLRPSSAGVVAETLHAMIRSRLPKPPPEPDEDMVMDIADAAAEFNMPLTTYRAGWDRGKRPPAAEELNAKLPRPTRSRPNPIAALLTAARSAGARLRGGS